MLNQIWWRAYETEVYFESIDIVAHRLINFLQLAKCCGALNTSDKAPALKYRFKWRNHTHPQIYLDWEIEQWPVDGAHIPLEMWARTRWHMIQLLNKKDDFSGSLKVFEPDWGNGLPRKEGELELFLEEWEIWFWIYPHGEDNGASRGKDTACSWKSSPWALCSRLL